MIEFLRNRCFRRRKRDIDSALSENELEGWCGSDAGRYIISAEQNSLNVHLSETAGYRGMLQKVVRTEFNIDSGPQLHRFVLASKPGADVSTIAEMDALPLPSDVVELAVLHHVLDCTEFPHEALKESARVVQASGHLIIVGFNPWSFFGLWRVFGTLFSCHAIWRCRCLSVARVTDWLKLVGFQPERISYGAYRPPLKSLRLLNRLGFLDRLFSRFPLPMGNYYVITARKMRLRPIRGKPEWLASAIKPVKLASRTQVKKEKKSN